MNIRAPARDIAKLKQLYCDIVGLREGWRPPFESRGHWLYAGTEPIVHLVDGEGDQQPLFRDPLGIGVELNVSARSC